jgi:Ni/Co efflux regulator RcnB
MQKLILAAVAAVIVSAPIASAVKAEDTTVIRKDEPDRDRTTVIKKKEDVNVLPVPHREEKKTIIKKDSD